MPANRLFPTRMAALPKPLVPRNPATLLRLSVPENPYGLRTTRLLTPAICQKGKDFAKNDRDQLATVRGKSVSRSVISSRQ